MTTLNRVQIAGSALSELQLRQWRENGYLILPRFFPREQIVAAAQEADDLLIRHRNIVSTNNLRCRYQPIVATGVSEFECFDPVIDLSLHCHQLALDARLLAVVGALYGEEACLFKDKLIYKRPGMKGYDLHQDYAPWDSFPRSFLTVLIPFDQAGPENGCTEVFPGCHTRGLLRPGDKNYAPLPLEAVGDTSAVPLVLDLGDIALFDGFTPHRSAPNHSDRWRRQFFPSYNKLSEGGHCRPQHYQEFRDWMKTRYEEYGKTGMYYC
jgi:ectoine hydroxylase-related dioxygenase (phytanoyl-CoA dioxygenase family)